MAYTWVSASGGDIPDGASPQGREQNGEPLWVCRAEVNSGLHPGKVRSAFAGALIPWGGKEIGAFQYEVLMELGEWSEASGGDVPTAAADWGFEADGERLYVALANHEGGLHPGKIRPAFGAANIGYGGFEVKVHSYAVLIGR